LGCLSLQFEPPSPEETGLSLKRLPPKGLLLRPRFNLLEFCFCFLPEPMDCSSTTFHSPFPFCRSSLYFSDIPAILVLLVPTFGFLGAGELSSHSPHSLPCHQIGRYQRTAGQPFFVAFCPALSPPFWSVPSFLVLLSF